MRSYTAIVRSVGKEAANARVNLSTSDDGCPLYLLISQPPKGFDAIVGIELQITKEAVYVAGQLWGKRTRDDRKHVVLVARRPEVVGKPPDVCGTVEEFE